MAYLQKVEKNDCASIKICEEHNRLISCMKLNHCHRFDSEHTSEIWLLLKSNQTLIVPLHEHLTKKEEQISMAAKMIMFSLIFSYKTTCLIKTTGSL